MEYASKGVANAGLATGIIGTALGVLNNGFGNIFGVGNNCNGGAYNAYNNGCCSENTVVNRYDLNLAQEMASLKSENALLRADKYTDQKLTEVYKDLAGQINALKDTVSVNTCNQAVTNQKLADNISFVDSKFVGVEKDIIQAKNDVLCYVNGTFVPGKLVMPLDSICPPAQPATTTPTTGQ